jgi:hypothetical protein
MIIVIQDVETKTNIYKYTIGTFTDTGPYITITITSNAGSADTTVINDTLYNVLLLPTGGGGGAGAPGATGATGAAGAAATITVASTTTGAAGTSAIVTNSGTTSACDLNFTIPKGDTGTAATINIGTVTTTAPGTNATVTNIGTIYNATFNFTIPMGVTNVITPASLYPYPTSSKTGYLPAASRTYAFTYSLPIDFTFNKVSVCFNLAASDTYRIGLYRGDLSTGVLVGKVGPTTPSSVYQTTTLTLESGQSFAFLAGSQVSVVYVQNGITMTPAAYTTAVSNVALAFVYSTSITPPSNMSTYTNTTPPRNATSTRICMDMI